jgi:uncharacterized protein
VPAASQDRNSPVPTSRLKRLGIRLLVALVVLYAVYEVFMAWVNIRTNTLWYRSVDAGSVYDTVLGTQILLFAVFGLLAAVAVAGSLVLVIRHRPPFRPNRARHKWRFRYLRIEKRFRLWLIAAVALYLGVRAGTGAAHRWQA